MGVLEFLVPFYPINTARMVFSSDSKMDPLNLYTINTVEQYGVLGNLCHTGGSLLGGPFSPKNKQGDRLNKPICQLSENHACKHFLFALMLLSQRSFNCVGLAPSLISRGNNAKALETQLLLIRSIIKLELSS